MPATLPETFGRYRIVKKLGEGGMGAVYLAHDTEMDRPVALKVPQFDKREQAAVIEQFKREARIAARIRHPGICTIHDVGCLGGIHYLTMAYIEGRELADVLAEGQPWPPARAIELVIRIAEALHELHTHGIVHRDLKPGNILLQPNNQPVLLDFGLARSVMSQSEQMATRSAGQGTPAYMAPEQWAAQVEQIKPWTDVYALGVILFELLTGERPFKPASFVELYGQVLHAERPCPSEFVPGIAPALDQLCRSALAIDPQQRPADMLQLIARLRQESTATVSSAAYVTACPNCGKRVRITEKMASKRVLCPGCRAPLLALGPQPQVVPLKQTSPVEPEFVPERVPTETLQFEHVGTSSMRAATRPGGYPVLLVVVLLGVVLVGGIGVGLLLLGQGTATTSSQDNAPSKEKPPPPRAEESITNSIGMKLVLIPAGKFRMGSAPADRARVEAHFQEVGLKPEDYKQYFDSEQPQHEVEITQPFYLGVYEVTQEEYEQVMKTNPSAFSKGGARADQVKGLDTKRFPVEMVSWDDAVKFCETLSNLPAEKAKKRVYRLPTEAEWEYACRGGATSHQLFHYGDKLTHVEANFDTDYPFNSNDKKPALRRPVAVDDPQYKPNAFGLYHMHGNVEEWCQDRYDEKYYQTCLDQKIRQNPQGPQDQQNNHRVLRGGCWGYFGRNCRSALRNAVAPDVRGINLGFRVVCVRTP